jgi:peptidoglycan/xylan/chitin deacetylase (PgdA/CDA1 family)
MYLLVVNFHYISDRVFDYPGIYPVTPRAFERQLEILGASFEFVGLQEIDEHLRGGQRLPEFACLISFDDGLTEQFDHAWPILRRKGIPAGFFVNTGPVLTGTVSSVHQIHWLRAHIPAQQFLNDILALCARFDIQLESLCVPNDVVTKQYRYDMPEVQQVKYILNFALDRLDRERVIATYFEQQFGDAAALASQLYMPPSCWRVLAAHGCLGTHSRNHLPLAELSFAEQVGELRQSLVDLRDQTGHTPFAVSYPYGGPRAVSPDLVAAAQAAGLRLGFTMERAFNRSLDAPLLLARVDTNDAPGGKSPQIEIVNSYVKLVGNVGARRSLWVDEHG